jgi:hypothetical protein
MPRRFEAVAVDTASRSQGIASALLGGCVALYDQLGYLLIYGVFQPSWGLAAFYQALDFDVLPAGYGIDVKVIVAGRACWALRAGSSYYALAPRACADRRSTAALAPRQTALRHAHRQSMARLTW